MSYALYKRLLPPSAVDHCVSANFQSPLATNLIVSRGSVLALYAVRSALQAEDDNSGRVARLDLIAEYELAGVVQSLAVVRLPQTTTDCVIASFDEAKVAVVEWDPTAHNLRTVSLHFYENETSLKSGRTQFTLPQIIRVDNDNRCAVVLLYDRHLAVIPFISDSSSSERTGQATKFAQSYLIDLQKLGMINIIDFQFVYGYYEPTLMFLCEPDRTWAGRYAKKKNTCSAAIISLHVLQGSHTTIWKLDKLPHDCHTIAPLAPPTGGALILAPNEVLYLNQSTSRYRLSLNYFGDGLQSGITERSKIPLCLEATRFTFLDDDTLLTSTHNGDLFAMTIVTDGRTVTHIDVQKAGSSALASCLCTLSHDMLFLGSRVGDSLLIRFTQKAVEAPAAPSDASAPTDSAVQPSAPIATTQLDFINAEDMDDEIASLVDLMLHSKKAHLMNQQQAQFPRWHLQVCDVISSLAPVSSVTLERSFDTLDVEDETSMSQRESKFLEMVCATGRGKSGCLAVIQQAIRPSVVTSLELPGCQAMWSVYHQPDDQPEKPKETTNEEGDDTIDPDSPECQKYLIMSRAQSTMVLRTGETISEVTNDAEFRVNEQTLNVGNMFGKSRYVQVHEGGFYLVDGLRPAQIESVPDGVQVVWSSILDPYLLLLLSDDSLLLYHASPESGRLRQIALPLRQEESDSPISTCCVFQDTSNMMPFNRWIQGSRPAEDVNPADVMEVDDDTREMRTDPDEIQLYGISSSRRKSKKRSRAAFSEEPQDTELPEEDGQATPVAGDDESHSRCDEAFIPSNCIERPFYAALARSNGALEIYSMPDFTLVWRSLGLATTNELLTSQAAPLSSGDDPAADNRTQKLAKMPVEIAFVPLGSSHLSSTLFVLYDTHELAIYRSFCPKPQLAATLAPQLTLSFRRMHTEVLCHNLRKPGGTIAEMIAAAQRAAEQKAMKQDAAPQAGAAMEDGDDADVDAQADDDEDEELEAEAEGVETRIISPHRNRWVHHRIKPFFNVQGKAGVFIGGLRPLWVFCERDHVRAFLMDLDGPVFAFSPFNNVNCPEGFIYYAQSSAKLKISQLKNGWSFDMALPVMRVPIRATPHSVVYDPENDTLAVVLSHTYKDMTQFIRPAPDDKKDKEREEDLISRGIDPASVVYKESDVPKRMPPIYAEKFELRLINTDNWEMSDSYALRPDEVGRASRLFLKTSESDYAESKLQPFLCMTTTTVRGEDASCKGRVLVFEINKETRADTGTPTSRLNLLVDKEQKGPVSALGQVEGTLILSVSQKLFFFHLKNKRDLNMIGFFDMQFLVTNIVTVRKYIIATDVYDSVLFLRWRERVRAVDLLSKDSDHMGAVAAGLLVDHERLSFLVADSKHNLSMYGYDPKNPATHKGQKLLCLGNFHLGAYINQITRVKLNRLNFPAMGNQFPKHGSLFGTHDGSVAIVAPINADKFKRLGKLEIRLVSGLNHTCGLNPKAFRLWRPRWHMTHNHQRRFIDGNLIWRFPELDRQTQERFASLVGSSVEELLDDLMELELAIRLF